MTTPSKRPFLAAPIKFDRDLFISYGHIDNESLSEGQDGWVSTFHRGLEIRLAQLRGEKPRIWRDQKFQGNDDFSDTILEQFPNLALLVSILSPRYVKSTWCLRELEHFAAILNMAKRCSGLGKGSIVMTSESAKRARVVASTRVI